MPESDNHALALEPQAVSLFNIKHISENMQADNFERTLLAIPNRSKDDITVGLTWLDPQVKLSLFAVQVQDLQDRSSHQCLVGPF